MGKSVFEKPKGIEELAAKCQVNSKVDPALYSVYDVKRGLRDINGLGVVAGLTQISEILSYEIVDGEKRPMDGILRYRGIHINDICKGFVEASGSVLKKPRICCCLENFQMSRSWRISENYSAREEHFLPILSGMSL